MQEIDFIYPDLDWYSEISERKNAPLRCRFANVHRCPRYYSSLYLLGNADITTKMEIKKIKELDELWNRSDLLPVIAEHDTGITSSGDKRLGFNNFCPEISYDVFGLFAVFLHRYTDEIDMDQAHARLAKEGHQNDWRWGWAHIAPLHYLKCPVYSQLITRPVIEDSQAARSNSRQDVIEVKPGFMGISINICAAISRLAKWWLSKQQR